MSTDAIITEADIDLIKRIIPHRYPFLFIDKVRDIVPNASGTGIKNVTFNEPHFQGHFPGTPIMPGVTIIEAMAQTAAVLVGVSNDLIGTGFLIYFMSIEKAKFRRKVVPGDVLELRMTLQRGKPGGKVWRFHGDAVVDGKIVAEADVTAMADMPKDRA